MGELKNVLKKKKVWIPLSIVIIVGGIILWAKDSPEGPEFVVAERGELIQEVNVTGRVKAAQSLDLAFEKSGRVAQVYVNVGDKIGVGWPLVRLWAGELVAQLSEAEANVDAEEARLSELERGSRPEEIEIKEAEFAKAEQDLINYYSGVSDIINDA